MRVEIRLRIVAAYREASYRPVDLAVETLGEGVCSLVAQ